MEVQPVKRYTADKYPTRDILDCNPELLRVTPRRWQTNAAVLTALTTAGLLLAARTGQTAEASHVAPIFQHGEGRGGFAGMTLNPPLFLSEEEARQVIIDEAKTAGIDLSATGLTLPEFPLPVTSLAGDNRGENETKEGDLQLDGWDQARKIGFEFISQEDYSAWAGYWSAFVEKQYSMQSTARRLQASLAENKPDGAFAVFYDPVVYTPLTTDPLVASQDLTESTLAPVTIFQIGEDPKRVEENGRITLSCGEHRIRVTLNSTKAVVDERNVTLASPVVARYGVPYVPLLSFAREVGATIIWEQENGKITLQMPGQQFQPSSPLLAYQAKNRKQQQTFAFAYNDWEGHLNFARDTAQEQLRQQVKDFIAWLKVQQVI